MPVLLTGLMRVRIATTQAGPYTNVGQVRSADYERGREGSTTLRYFGGDSTVPGAKTLSGSMPVWWDPSDTAGQKAMVTAYNNDSKVWLQFAWEGTATSKKADQFEAVIDSVSVSGDAEGEAVEGTFSFTGTPSTFSEVTLT